MVDMKEYLLRNFKRLYPNMKDSIKEVDYMLGATLRIELTNGHVYEFEYVSDVNKTLRRMI